MIVQVKVVLQKTYKYQLLFTKWFGPRRLSGLSTVIVRVRVAPEKDFKILLLKKKKKKKTLNGFIPGVSVVLE